MNEALVIGLLIVSIFGFLACGVWVGLTLALLPWGLVTDRVGERRALTIGLPWGRQGDKCPCERR